MLRDATEADKEKILVWRNHPRVRETHFLMRVITPQEHEGWWATVLAGTRRALIYERSGVPAGVVHFGKFDPAESSAHWGFFLDIDSLEPAGDLLPAWLELEREAIDYAFDTLGLVVLRGETLVHNTVVRQLHRRFGFTESPVFARDVEGIRQEAVVTELTAADHRRRGARSRVR